MAETLRTEASLLVPPNQEQGRNDAAPTLPPILPERLVLVAKAARVAGVRSDLLLKALRRRGYPIHGIPGAYSADLNHILATLPPNKRNQVKKWAKGEFGEHP